MFKNVCSLIAGQDRALIVVVEIGHLAIGMMTLAVYLDGY